MNYQNFIDQIVTTKQGREFFVEYVKINRKGVFVAELGNNQLVNINDLTSPNYAEETRKNPQSSSKKPKREKQEEQSVRNSNEPAQEVKKPGQEEVVDDEASETKSNI